MQEKSSVGGDITCEYVVKGGVCESRQYGIRLAKTMGFPESLIQEAQSISEAVSYT